MARPLRAAQAGGARPALRDGRPTRRHLHHARLPDSHRRRDHRQHERHAQPRGVGRIRARNHEGFEGSARRDRRRYHAGLGHECRQPPHRLAERDRGDRRRADADAALLGHGAGRPAPDGRFAQLVDNTTGLVIGNQVTPVALTLDGRTHTLTVPLESIAFTFERGRNVTAQIVATTVAYGTPRLGGKVTMQATVSLPVSTLTPR